MEKTVFIDNLKINLRVVGQGEPILILHGWDSSIKSWLKVQEFLAKKGFKVFVPDLPGFGKSAPPPFAWGIQDYSDFILSFVKEFNLDPFFLLSHSFGGRISVRFCNDHPERIKRLILCSSAAIKPKPGLKTRLIYIVARIGNAVFTPRHLTRLKDGARNIFYSFLRNKDYVKAKGVMRETIIKVITEDLLPDLPSIKVKTLLVWGKNDKLVPVKFAYIFKDNLENSRLEILPKIGHSPQLEVPEKLSELILNFLRE